jgi:hypothetical protein
MLSLCRRMPKVELHAHLHGSIRQRTLIELMISKGYSEEDATSTVGVSMFEEDSAGRRRPRCLADCFRLFDVLHECVDSLQVICTDLVQAQHAITLPISKTNICPISGYTPYHQRGT